MLSGELVVSGFHFDPVIGTDWIVEEPDQWLLSYAALAQELGVSVFINHPEREGERCFNTLFDFDASGTMCGKHRKLCVTPIIEAWSTPGEDIQPVMVDGVSVGLLVCADAYPPGIVTCLKALGAEVLLSSAAWHPGEWGPSGEWQARSGKTQLPLIVCNRTGVDADVSFSDSESVLVKAGRRIETTLRNDNATVFLVDLELTSEGSSLTLVDQQPFDSGHDASHPNQRCRHCPPAGIGCETGLLGRGWPSGTQLLLGRIRAVSTAIATAVAAGQKCRGRQYLVAGVRIQIGNLSNLHRTPVFDHRRRRNGRLAPFVTRDHREHPARRADRE